MVTLIVALTAVDGAVYGSRFCWLFRQKSETKSMHSNFSHHEHELNWRGEENGA